VHGVHNSKPINEPSMLVLCVPIHAAVLHHTDKACVNFHSPLDTCVSLSVAAEPLLSLKTNR